jgi:hypothetical protein
MHEHDQSPRASVQITSISTIKPPSTDFDQKTPRNLQTYQPSPWTYWTILHHYSCYCHHQLSAITEMISYDRDDFVRWLAYCFRRELAKVPALIAFGDLIVANDRKYYSWFLRKERMLPSQRNRLKIDRGAYRHVVGNLAVGYSPAC